MLDYNIRPAVDKDCEEITRLRQELADYSNVLEKMGMTAEKLRRDGFGEQKCFECFVVEDTTTKTADGRAFLWGYALYFYTYSTWVGRVLFLEDLYVSAVYRGRGIGSKLFQTVAKAGITQGCERMKWEAYSWNKPSIDFYKNRGACDVTASENLNVFQMNRQELEHLSKS
ncbi:diamine acetyltransferase 2-like [Mizuhopecten yessoensis]|uniref:diamine acetyltransferase 2-like n=1 Tax=Mizuhopecten yessoensis TaxID=6573 RepID=UPI000B45A082|nr:diamine acetyltransferase 2-like [Mizuhopecten yessoensis]